MQSASVVLRLSIQAVCCFQSGLIILFQVAVNGANLQNVFMLLTLEPLLARSPFLVLHVRRNHLVGDALRELSIHSDIDLKKPLKVSQLNVLLLFLCEHMATEILLRCRGQPFIIGSNYFYKNLITSFCQITRRNISLEHQIK